MDVLALITALVTLVCFAYMTGLFISFSNTIMPAFDANDPTYAVHSMRTINRKITNPLFLFSFAASLLVAALTGVLALVADETGSALLFFASAAVYLFGNLVPTRAVNIPLNNMLDQAEIPTDPAEMATLWSNFSGKWTRWNTVRAVFCALSVVLIGLGLYAWGG